MSNVHAVYPADQMAKARKAAGNLMAKFDTNKDGFISQSESSRGAGISNSIYTERFSDSYVWRTVVTYQNTQSIKDFGRLDHNGDGRISADEVAQQAALDTDWNKDGKLGFFEKLFSTWSGKVNGNTRTSQREIGRQRDLVYDPVQSDRPRPPGVDTGSDRPRPPEVDSGSDRPRPPEVDSGSGRPRPPGL